MERQLILGRAVFGTMRGLFAEGEGELASISASAEIFELGRVLRDELLIPGHDELIYFRRPIVDDNGRIYDLLGLCCGAFDLSNRPGYLGYCFGVQYGTIGAYKPAFLKLRDGFEDVAKFFLQSGQRFRDMHGKRFFSSENRVPSETVRYTLAGDGDLIRHFCFDESLCLPPEIILDTLIEVAAYEGKAAPTIAVSNRRRHNSILITGELIQDYREKNAAREREEEARRSEAARVGMGQPSAAEAGRSLDTRLSSVENRLEKLEIRIGKLEVAQERVRTRSPREEFSRDGFSDAHSYRYCNFQKESRLSRVYLWIQENGIDVLKLVLLWIFIVLLLVGVSFLVWYLVGALFFGENLIQSNHP